MAYNGFYASYPNYSYPQYQPSFQNTFQMPQGNTTSGSQIQNGGFISVRSAQEAFNYPVALGNSVTFKDETAPFIYVKTRGFSQLEEPVFEQFQLVKVNTAQKPSESPTQVIETQEGKDTGYALKSDTAALWGEIETLKKQLSELKEENTKNE